MDLKLRARRRSSLSAQDDASGGRRSSISRRLKTGATRRSPRGCLAMRHDSSFTFVLIGDHSQDGTWPLPAAAPSPLGKPDWSRTSVSTSVRARVVYSPPPRP